MKVKGMSLFRKYTGKDLLKNSLIALALFAVYMILYCFQLHYPYFSDEADVFEKGYLISRGGRLYDNLISQHMPFSYYMAAFISLFGPVSIYQFRFGFYILLSVIYIVLYFSHHKDISPAALVIMPVFFLLQLPRHSYGFSMMSDHWQGLGIAIILLELMRYLQKKEITVSMAVWISFGVQLSFGCAFLAAYALLPIVLAVAAIQVNLYRKTQTENRKAFRKQLIRQDLILLGIILLPMVILLGYYALTGNLGNFIEGAYTLNREVYPKYLGGYGSSVLGLFSETWSYFVRTYKPVLDSFLSFTLDAQQLGLLILFVCTVAVSVYYLVHRHVAAGLGWFFAVMLCGVRGFNGFHGMPYLFAASLSVALVFSWCMRRMINDKIYIWGVAGVLMIALVGYEWPSQLQQVKNNLHLLFPQKNETKILLDAILDPDDPIHVTNVTQMGYSVDYQRPQDYGSSISTPWTYEVYGEKELQALQDQKTKVVFYTPGYVLWNRNADEYGEAVANYIQNNYTRYDQSDLWILSDYWDEAMDRMAPVYNISDETGAPQAAGKMLLPSESISQSVKVSGRTCFAVMLQTQTDNGLNPAGLTLEIYDKDKKQIASGHVDRSAVMDHDWTVFSVYAETIPGNEYEFRFTADACEGETHISPVLTANSELCIQIADDYYSVYKGRTHLSKGDAAEFANIGITGKCIEYLNPDQDMILQGISLQIGKYADTANGIVGLKLVDSETGTVIAQALGDTSKFADSAYSDFLFHPTLLVKGKPYEIWIYMEDDTLGAPALGVAREIEGTENDDAYSNYGEDGKMWDYCMYLIPADSLAGTDK